MWTARRRNAATIEARVSARATREEIRSNPPGAEQNAQGWPCVAGHIARRGTMAGTNRSGMTRSHDAHDRRQDAGRWLRARFPRRRDGSGHLHPALAVRRADAIGRGRGPAGATRTRRGLRGAARPYRLGIRPATAAGGVPIGGQRARPTTSRRPRGKARREQPCGHHQCQAHACQGHIRTNHRAFAKHTAKGAATARIVPRGGGQCKRFSKPDSDDPIGWMDVKRPGLAALGLTGALDRWRALPQQNPGTNLAKGRGYRSAMYCSLQATRSVAPLRWQKSPSVSPGWRYCLK